MSQRYSLDPFEDEERQIARTEFNREKGKVHLFYHYRQGKITNRSRTFETADLLDTTRTGDNDETQETP
jgi:hypothetical protein